VVTSDEFRLVVFLAFFVVLVKVSLVVIIVAAATSAGALSLVVSGNELMLVIPFLVFIKVTLVILVAATTSAGPLTLVVAGLDIMSPLCGWESYYREGGNCESGTHFHQGRGLEGDG
jgi:hypothetical protein